MSFRRHTVILQPLQLLTEEALGRRNRSLSSDSGNHSKTEDLSTVGNPAWVLQLIFHENQSTEELQRHSTGLMFVQLSVPITIVIRLMQGLYAKAIVILIRIRHLFINPDSQQPGGCSCHCELATNLLKQLPV